MQGHHLHPHHCARGAARRDLPSGHQPAQRRGDGGARWQWDRGRFRRHALVGQPAERRGLRGVPPRLPPLHAGLVRAPCSRGPSRTSRPRCNTCGARPGALGISRKNIVVQGMSAGARVGAVAYTTPNDEYFAGPELWPDISDTVNGFIGFYHPYDGSMQYSSQYYGGSDESSDPRGARALGRGRRDCQRDAGRGSRAVHHRQPRLELHRRSTECVRRRATRRTTRTPTPS